MNLNNLLFIGLNGYAGSGKDTVAKMLKTILGYNWTSLEECKNFYQKIMQSIIEIFNKFPCSFMSIV